MNNLKFRAINTLTFEVLEQLYEGQCFQWVHSELQENIAINQYTGIKDIDGNEIYVGDIVSRVYRNSWDTEDRFESPEAVEFSQCDASIQGSVSDVPMLAFNLGGFPLTLDDKYKIVGNIYENKDLINHQ